MAIELKDISYRYENADETNLDRMVLSHINLTIHRNEFTAIIGATGSGKSTLVQHLNLLLKATEGDILYDDESIYGEDFNRKALRGDVGLVFQYPEYQLFETDIYSDVCFGPKNLGLLKTEINKRATRALELVGISPEDYKRSPFELSGGQKRRVAIAGVLAMQPKYLVLDEPAAGLDPKGRREMLDTIKRLHEEAHIGVILVSHSMDDVAEYADKIVVIEHGEIKLEGEPREVFSHRTDLEEMGLSIPQASLIADKLRERGVALPQGLITMNEVRDAILKLK